MVETEGVGAGVGASDASGVGDINPARWPSIVDAPRSVRSVSWAAPFAIQARSADAILVDTWQDPTTQQPLTLSPSGVSLSVDVPGDAEAKFVVGADGETALADGAPIADSYIPPAKFYEWLDQFLADSPLGRHRAVVGDIDRGVHCLCALSQLANLHDERAVLLRRELAELQHFRCHGRHPVAVLVVERQAQGARALQRSLPSQTKGLAARSVQSSAPRLLEL